MDYSEKQTKDVLLIEDERALSEVLGERIQESGFTLDKAYNGKEGLALIEKIQYRVILLDILMPEMDGQEFLQVINASPEHKDTKIIMLSNLSDSQNVSRATINGAVQYIVKAENSMEQIVNKISLAIS